MNEFLQLLKENYIFAISEAGIELNQYFKDLLHCRYLSDLNEEDKVAVLVLLLYADCNFKITISNDYTINDHRFWGTNMNYPCKTIFIHSSINDFEKNMKMMQETILDFH